MTEVENAEVYQFKRQRRKSCLIKILTFWFSLLAVILIAMIFIRSNVNRDPAAINQNVASLFRMTLPNGYQAYSQSDFFRAHTVSYWDQNHLREDGRTTSLIAIYYEDKWRDWSLQKLVDQVLSNMEERLERNSFHTKQQDVISEEQGGETIQIFRFKGMTRLEEKLLDGTTLFRFVMTPKGPVQIQTLGLDSDFPEDIQLAFMRSITPLLDPNHAGD